MERIMTLKQIASACCGRLENCDEAATVSEVITDSRKVCPDSLFIALRGENFDGHDFVGNTLSGGASACVVDENFDNSAGYAVIVVKDTFRALGEIAAFYRSKFAIPSVGITGSVEKTSTKDMVSCVLAQKYEVLKTEGNFNNEIGLPLTAFRLAKTTDIAVFEMGMSAFGEISRLTKIAAPETAIITNIGMSHIEHLGSQENILKAKLEILEGISGCDGTVILNGDDPFLNSVVGSLHYETLTYGINNKKCDIVAENTKQSSNGTSFDVRIDGKSVYPVKVNVPGIHHVYNALAAMLTGIKYNMAVLDIIKGVALFQPQGMRQNAVILNNYVIIKDCYNASPTSMKSGLAVLAVTAPKDKNESHRKVAVLADMLELGEYSEQAHREVGGMVAEFGIDCLVAIGPNAENISKGALENGFNQENIFTFENNEKAKMSVMKILKPNDVVLFKGSRGMRLEEVADFVAASDME